MLNVKLGKRPAVHDERVPHFSVVTRRMRMALPPDVVNWYAAVEDWPMLANDSVGDCVEAASLHALQQFTKYADAPMLVPTDAEALDFYKAATGYNPDDPATDQGSYVLGPNGTMDYWHTNGIMCGGVLNKVTAYLQLQQPDPVYWRQAIWVFGGMMVGLNLPNYIIDQPETPFVWEYVATTSFAGGHEVWVNGYNRTPDGYYYDLVSWGRRYRVKERFLLNYMDEACAIYDKSSLNKQGLDGRGLPEAELVSLMSELRRTA